MTCFIDSYSHWSQVVEELPDAQDKTRSLKSSAGVDNLVSVSSEEHYGSFIRKKAKPVDTLGSQVEFQTTNSGSNNRVFHENNEDSSTFPNYKFIVCFLL